MTTNSATARVMSTVSSSLISASRLAQDHGHDAKTQADHQTQGEAEDEDPPLPLVLGQGSPVSSQITYERLLADPGPSRLPARIAPGVPTPAMPSGSHSVLLD